MDLAILCPANVVAHQMEGALDDIGNVNDSERRTMNKVLAA